MFKTLGKAFYWGLGLDVYKRGFGKGLRDLKQLGRGPRREGITSLRVLRPPLTRKETKRRIWSIRVLELPALFGIAALLIFQVYRAGTGDYLLFKLIFLGLAFLCVSSFILATYVAYRRLCRKLDSPSVIENEIAEYNKLWLEAYQSMVDNQQEAANQESNNG